MQYCDDHYNAQLLLVLMKNSCIVVAVVVDDDAHDNDLLLLAGHTEVKQSLTCSATANVLTNEPTDTRQKQLSLLLLQ